MAQLNPFLNIAFKAARRAGDAMLRASGQLHTFKPDSKPFYDFIQDITQQSEQTLVQVLQEAYPHHRITTAQTPITQHADWEWLITPLDGVENYAREQKDYAVSLALLEKGVLKEALIYAPQRNDLYTATRGEGARLNDKRIRVGNRVELGRCIMGIATQTNYNKEQKNQYIELMNSLIYKTYGLRTHGVPNLDLCELATGGIDGIVSPYVSAYDIAAGALVVQEAGGIITDNMGEYNCLNGGSMIAANPKILAQIITLLAPRA